MSVFNRVVVTMLILLPDKSFVRPVEPRVDLLRPLLTATAMAVL